MKELIKPKKTEETFSTVKAFCEMSYGGGNYQGGSCSSGSVYNDTESNGDDILF